MLYATYVDVVESNQGGQVTLFIGPPHAQALPDNEIEVLVQEFPGAGKEAIVFHVMPLGPKFRKYREENP